MLGLCDLLLIFVVAVDFFQAEWVDPVFWPLTCAKVVGFSACRQMYVAVGDTWVAFWLLGLLAWGFSLVSPRPPNFYLGSPGLTFFVL